MFVAGDESASTITVSKAELLKALKNNRTAHRGLFEEAQVGYREAVIQELDAMLAAARHGRDFKKAIMLEEPQDHTRDYDRVIRMLEMCTKEEVFINESEFAQYVMDDWSWKRQFVTTAANYSKMK